MDELAKHDEHVEHPSEPETSEEKLVSPTIISDEPVSSLIYSLSILGQIVIIFATEQSGRG